MKVKNKIWVKISAMLFLSYSVNVFAYLDNLESVDKINELARNFVMQNASVEPDETLDVQVSQMSSPLRLPACTNEIKAALPKDSNRNQINAVEVSCDGVRPWHAFVPVNVQVYTRVVVAKHLMSPKDIIGENDLDFAQADRSRLFNGYFKTKEEALGLESAQMIAPGTVLTKTNLQRPVLVHRNEAVDLIAGNNSIVVTMKGLAKTDGRLNEVIKAFNPASNRALDAIVIGSGKAKVIG